MIEFRATYPNEIPNVDASNWWRLRDGVGNKAIGKIGFLKLTTSIRIGTSFSCI